MSEVEPLFTVSVLLKNQQQRVLGFRRFIEASQAHGRLELARSNFLGDGELPEGEEDRGQIVRIKDDFSQLLCVDVAEIASTSLMNVGEAQRLIAELQYHELRGQHHRNALIKKDGELYLALRGNQLQLAPGHG